MERRLHKKINQIKIDINTLWEKVEKNVFEAIESLEKKSKPLAHQVIKTDHEVDLKEVEIEQSCLKTLALYHPVAVDLRVIISILKINNSLERISDLAANISKSSLFFVSHPEVTAPFSYKPMFKKVENMLTLSKKAFMESNVVIASDVCKLDDEVDQLHLDHYGYRPKRLEDYPYYTYLISTSRNLERIADYATNICEDIIYMESGQIIRHGKESF